MKTVNKVYSLTITREHRNDGLGFSDKALRDAYDAFCKSFQTAFLEALQIDDVLARKAEIKILFEITGPSAKDFKE